MAEELKTVTCGNTPPMEEGRKKERRNAAAQMAEKLKTVACATPPMEEGRKKERLQCRSRVRFVSSLSIRQSLQGRCDWLSVR